MKPPLIIPNFLTTEQCQKFIDHITKDNTWYNDGNKDNIWNNRTKWPNQQITEVSILNDLKAISERVKLEAATYFETSEIYAESPHFVRWEVGNHLWPPHADKENADGSPHPFSWRDFGAVIYLNDNFEGGEIEYPKFNLKLKITQGTLAVHLGTLDYLHGVWPITAGTRYTIASFLTQNKQYGYYDQ